MPSYDTYWIEPDGQQVRFRIAKRGGWMHARHSTLETLAQRRTYYRENVREVFRATADFYYAFWGDFFHFALFEPGDDPTEFEAAFTRTHERYFAAIQGPTAGRILELATGGGALAVWMAERTAGEVVGVDLSETQLARARRRLARSGRGNLRFLKHDIMRLAELDEPPFDAALCLDAGCYLPDRAAALRAVGSCLRPGARLLVVDWCRPESVGILQEELILEPFYRAWGIPELERVYDYERAFTGAGFRLLHCEDLSDRVTPNWERAYTAVNRALVELSTPAQLVRILANRLRHGEQAFRLARAQFHAVLLAKAAADAGVIRYVLFLAERNVNASHGAA